MEKKLSPRPAFIVFTALTLLAVVPMALFAISAGGGTAWFIWFITVLKASAAAAVLLPLVVGIAVFALKAYRFVIYLSATLGLLGLVNSVLFYRRMPSYLELAGLNALLAAVGGILSLAYLAFAWVLHARLAREKA